MTAKCPECESTDYIDPETGECELCEWLDPPERLSAGYTREACLAAIKRANRRFDHPITSDEYDSLGMSPSLKTIIGVCGSWNDAKRYAGIDRYNNRGEVVD